MRPPRTFVDTNILVYAFAEPFGTKGLKASEAMLKLGNQMIVSTQVLHEFYNVATRKLGMPSHQARQVIVDLSNGEVVSSSPPMLIRAIDLSDATECSFWDALIIQAAIDSRCVRLFTEDLNHGQLINGVRIENPLR